MDEEKRERLMLRWLAKDPWLTSAQMGTVIGCKATSAAAYLSELKAHGWVQSLAPREPELPRELVYALTDEGLRELARVKGRNVAEMAGRYQVSRAALIRSLNDLRHHWRVREYLLCKLATHFGGMQVEWCWPRHFGKAFVFKDYSDRTGRLRPDCYGMVTEQGRGYAFFVLWDDGLTPMLLERRRVRAYEKAQLIHPWGFNFWTFPLLAIVARSPARAQQYRERLRSNYHSSLRVFVTDQVTLRCRHPLAPIWWRGTHDKTFGRRDEDECVWMLKEASGIPLEEYRFTLGWDDPTWIETADLNGALPPAQRIIGSPLSRLIKRKTLPRKNNGRGVLGHKACCALGLQLSPPEKLCLRLLGPLRVLTARHLQRYFGTTPERCRRWLTHLMRLGLGLAVNPPARAFLTGKQKLYVLSPDGLQWVARQSHHGLKRFRQFYGVALAADGTRLVHERLIPHHLECVGRMLAFHEAARAVTRGGRSRHALEHWVGERSAILVWQSPKHNRYGRPLLDKLRPDAYGVYSIGTKMGDFWLEVDRGKQRFRSSQWLDDGPYSFATKVRAYYDYVTRLEWLDCRAPVPALLVVTKNQQRAAELRRVFIEVALEQWSGRLPVPAFVTTAERFRTQGPLAPIWQAARADDLTYCFMTLREESTAASGAAGV